MDDKMMEATRMVTCTVCGKQVDSRGSLPWRHEDGTAACEIAPGVVEVDRQPIPGFEVCDFCSGDGPFKVMVTQPGTEATLETETTARHLIDVDGLWAVCQGCERFLVPAVDLDGLFERVVQESPEAGRIAQQHGRAPLKVALFGLWKMVLGEWDGKLVEWDG